jgi:hypothetical protein
MALAAIFELVLMPFDKAWRFGDLRADPPDSRHMAAHAPLPAGEAFVVSCRKRPRPFTNAFAMSEGRPRPQTAHVRLFVTSFPNNGKERCSPENEREVTDPSFVIDRLAW